MGPRLADDDGPGGAETVHALGVMGRGRAVCEGVGATSGGMTGDIKDVLDRDWDPVQDPTAFPRHGIECTCHTAGTFRVDQDEGVQLVPCLLDPSKGLLDELGGTQRPGTGQRCSGRQCQVSAHLDQPGRKTMVGNTSGSLSSS